MKAIYCFIFLILISCSRAYDFENYDINKVESEALMLLTKHPGAAFDIDVSNLTEIKRINPEDVYTTKDGVFIILNSNFWSEQGLFIPRDGVKVDTSTGSDPLFSRLSGKVFQYKLKG